MLMIIPMVDDLPEEITQHIQLFLSERPGWTQARILQSALSLFLLQNGMRRPGSLSALSTVHVSQWSS